MAKWTDRGVSMWVKNIYWEKWKWSMKMKWKWSISHQKFAKIKHFRYKNREKWSKTQHQSRKGQRKSSKININIRQGKNSQSNLSFFFLKIQHCPWGFQFLNIETLLGSQGRRQLFPKIDMSRERKRMNGKGGGVKWIQIVIIWRQLSGRPNSRKSPIFFILIFQLLPEVKITPF